MSNFKVACATQGDIVSRTEGEMEREMKEWRVGGGEGESHCLCNSNSKEKGGCYFHRE